VSVGAKVQLCPSGTPATIDELQLGGESVESASAGAVVLATLSADAGEDVEIGGVTDNVMTWASGAVAYDESHECTKVSHFDGQMTIIEDPVPSPCRTPDFTNNFTTTIDLGFQHVPCTWKMVQKIDRRTGKVLEEGPKHLGQGDVGLVRLYPQVDIDFDDLEGNLIKFVSADKIMLKNPSEKTTAVGVVKAINAEGDDGPPKGKNSPENEEIPYNPCVRVPECVEHFFGECPDGCESGYMVAHDDEGNEIPEDEQFDYADCDSMTGKMDDDDDEEGYPGKGTPMYLKCCGR